MKLYVARHGETVWNRENKILGRTDKPLNETGVAQAAALAEEMRDKGIDLIISSPLLRARQTGMAVAEATGAPLIEDARFIEQHFGAFEGTSRLAEEYLAAKCNFATRLPGGGESLFDMAHRVYAGLYDIREKHGDKTVCVTTHNSVMRIVKTFFEDVDGEAFRTLSFKNAAAEEYTL